jgi:hypothetical protein
MFCNDASMLLAEKEKQWGSIPTGSIHENQDVLDGTFWLFCIP